MFRKILIPLDDSGCSRRAAQLGMGFAQQLGAPLVFAQVVNFWPTPETSPEARAEAERLKSEGLAFLENWASVAGAPTVTRCVLAPKVLEAGCWLNYLHGYSGAANTEGVGHESQRTHG